MTPSYRRKDFELDSQLQQRFLSIVCSVSVYIYIYIYIYMHTIILHKISRDSFLTIKVSIYI